MTRPLRLLRERRNGHRAVAVGLRWMGSLDCFDRGASAIVEVGVDTLMISGPQKYDVLTTNEGSTYVGSGLGTGGSTLNGNGTTNITTSQTLAALNIGDGAIVTLADASLPAPAFAGSDDVFGQTGEYLAGSPVQAVPEQGAAALVLSARATLAGLRRRKFARFPCAIAPYRFG